MTINRYKYSIWFKAIAIGVVCLFTWNNIAWANPDILTRSTLNPQLRTTQPEFRTFYAINAVCESLRRAYTEGSVADVTKDLRDFVGGNYVYTGVLNPSAVRVELPDEKIWITSFNPTKETPFLEKNEDEIAARTTVPINDDLSIEIVQERLDSASEAEDAPLLLAAGAVTETDAGAVEGTEDRGQETEDTKSDAGAVADRPSQDLTIEEIDHKMKDEGFPELAFLWEKFKKLKIGLDEIDEEGTGRSRIRHMGALLDRPVTMAIISGLVALSSFYFQYKNLDFTTSITHINDVAFSCMFAITAVYGFWFAVLSVQRIFIHSWGKISAIDLAMMLKQKSYREWFDCTQKAIRTGLRLRKLGINETWDDPSYKIRYRSIGENVEKAEIQSPQELVQAALREVLGFKEDRKFHPGRYIDSLKEGKGSVTKFVKVHQEKISQSKQGELPVKKGLALLQELRSKYLKTSSAGEKYINDIILAIERKDYLLEGMVEVKVWNRDPWIDLTHQKDFYSSVSLRGGSFMDSLQRRTKGILGPFGYLRNKSISALDFATKDGRSVRARIAAATYQDQEGNERPVLFVDGVEGRFNISPRLIKKAIEDYARTCGFDTVFYFKYPLNQVPQRFVKYVKGSGGQLEELHITYADASEREYLDAFGLPVEPFEYSFPKGKVIGYTVDVGSGTQRHSSVPGKAALFRDLVKGKGFLWGLVAMATVSAGWLIWRNTPQLLLPVGGAIGLVLVYDFVFQRRSLRAKHGNNRSQTEGTPAFIKGIKREISADPVAQKMGYEKRLQAKMEKLRQYFPALDSTLRYFIEEILFNVSIKDSDLINVLKFLNKLNDDKRREVTQLFGAVWPSSNEEAKRIGLSEEKDARNELKKKLFGRIDAIRKYIKVGSISREELRQISRMSKKLNLDILNALKIAAISPHILRGLKKPPRPIYAWIGPVLTASLFSYALAWLIPAMPLTVTYISFMLIVVPGVYFVSARLNIAPGVLCYEKTRKYISQILEGKRGKTKIEERMEELGVDIKEFERGKVYENKEKGIRIVIRDKKTLEGAVKFLTSSENIDSCIALRNFVSWALPSLLDDDGIMLADIYCKGTHATHTQRAQLWMVASEEEGRPVLTVNSFEFNDEGAKYIDEVMPEGVKVLQDVAERSGFKKIYVGISDFGREYLDRHFKQGTTKSVVKKIHSPEAGYQYYFDAFGLKTRFARWRIKREYIYAKKRGLVKRAYALVFGALELLKGNKAKAKAFFDTVVNTHNFWEVPLSSAQDTPHFGGPSGGMDISHVWPRAEPLLKKYPGWADLTAQELVKKTGTDTKLPTPRTRDEKSTPPGSYHDVFEVILDAERPMTKKDIAEELTKRSRKHVSPETITHDLAFLGPTQCGLITCDEKGYRALEPGLPREVGRAILEKLKPLGATRDRDLLNKTLWNEILPMLEGNLYYSRLNILGKSRGDVLNYGRTELPDGSTVISYAGDSYPSKIDHENRTINLGSETIVATNSDYGLSTGSDILTGCTLIIIQAFEGNKPVAYSAAHCNWSHNLARIEAWLDGKKDSKPPTDPDQLIQKAFDALKEVLGDKAGDITYRAIPIVGIGSSVERLREGLKGLWGIDVPEDVGYDELMTTMVTYDGKGGCDITVMELFDKDRPASGYKVVGRIKQVLEWEPEVVSQMREVNKIDRSLNETVAADGKPVYYVVTKSAMIRSQCAWATELNKIKTASNEHLVIVDDTDQLPVNETLKAQEMVRRIQEKIAEVLAEEDAPKDAIINISINYDVYKNMLIDDKDDLIGHDGEDMQERIQKRIQEMQAKIKQLLAQDEILAQKGITEDNINGVIFRGETQLEIILVALRAYERGEQVGLDALLELYRILKDEPYTGELPDINDRAAFEAFARLFIYTLPKAAKMPNLRRTNSILLAFIKSA